MKKILAALQDLPANQHSQFSHNLWNWAGLAELGSSQILKLKGSQDFLHTFSVALYDKWDVKNGFAYALTLFLLISDGLGSVKGLLQDNNGLKSAEERQFINEENTLLTKYSDLLQDFSAALCVCAVRYLNQ